MNAIQKKSFTVAIPAHNEEKNIASLLDDILLQRDENLLLKKILVVADGCTDRTVEIVKAYAKRNSLVKVLCDGKRLGKCQRLNQIYELCQSDFLITLDADIRLKKNDIFHWLIDPFKDTEVAVVGGNPRPLPGRTFLEKLVVTKDEWWYEARKDFNEGNNIYNSAGICFAFRNDFIKSFKFIPGTINDQEVIFLETCKQGKKFAFAQKAIVYIREAAHWAELLARQRRFNHQENLSEYGYGIEMMEYYQLPFVKKAKGIFKVLRRKPFYVLGSLILALLLNKILSCKKEAKGFLAGGLWDVSTSTKDLS